jgi:transposase-like protein
VQRNTTEQRETDLSPNQLKALAAMATGATVTAAAEHAGVDRTTLHRWIREDPGFQARLESPRK